MTERLTDEQRKLVEDNYKLIFHFMRYNGLTENDIIDWHGEAAVWLCRAAMHFDPTRSRAKFSTYAYMTMYYNMVRLKSAKRIKTVSLDYDYEDADDNLLNLISDHCDPLETLCFQEAIEEVESKLSKRDKEILAMVICCGKTQEEVAQIYGIKRAAVGMVCHKFAKNVREALLN